MLQYGEPWKRATRHKPGTKEQMLHKSIYKQYLNWADSWDRKQR